MYPVTMTETVKEPVKNITNQLLTLYHTSDILHLKGQEDGDIGGYIELYFQTSAGGKICPF